MKIHNTIIHNNTFGNKVTLDKEKEERKKDDSLTKYPIRLLAYSNEAGAALRPLPKIGEQLSQKLWWPAFWFFGADIYDKYSRGEKGDYSEKSLKAGVKEAVFQLFASVFMPTVAVTLGQNIMSKVGSFLNESKLDERAKLEILNHTKKEINRGSFDKQDYDINAFLKSINENKSKCKSVKKGFGRYFSDFMDYFKHAEDESYKYTAKSKDESVNKYASQIFMDVKELHTKLKNFNIANINDKELIKKVNLPDKTISKMDKLLCLYKNQEDGSSRAIKEVLNNFVLNKSFGSIFLKVAGGFAMLGFLIKPIDEFGEKVYMEKLMTPLIDKSSNLISILKGKKSYINIGLHKEEAIKQDINISS